MSRRICARDKTSSRRLLGDGWYSGNVGWIGGHVYGSRPAFLAQLVIDYTDGSREIVATDDTWRATVGPIRQSDFQDGEDYDARLEIPGWNSVGFDDSVLETGFDSSGKSVAGSADRAAGAEDA